MAQRRKRATRTAHDGKAKRGRLREERVVGQVSPLADGSPIDWRRGQEHWRRAMLEDNEERQRERNRRVKAGLLPTARDRKAFMRDLAVLRDAKAAEQVKLRARTNYILELAVSAFEHRMRALARSVAGQTSPDEEELEELTWLVMVFGVPPGFEDVSRQHPRGASRVYAALAKGLGFTAGGRPRLNRTPDEEKAARAESRSLAKAVTRRTERFYSLRANRDRVPWLASMTDADLVDHVIAEAREHRRSLPDGIANSADDAFRAEVLCIIAVSDPA